MCLFLLPGRSYKNNILDFSAAGGDDKHMNDYQEIYNEAVSMFAAATGETMTPEFPSSENSNILMTLTETEQGRRQAKHAILHELARQYLHEREQIEFEPEDTFIATGHAIWSEVSAELLARAIDEDGVPVMLYEMDLSEVPAEAGPQEMARYAIEILTSYEGRTATEWEKLREEMQRLGLPQDKIIRILFDRIKSGDWDVDELWLGSLGAAYYIENGLR